MTQEQALNILKSGANVFLTGEPGSGKTHTVNRYIEYLREHGVDPSITASTGIAATHVGGMTIHSWSGVGIRKTLSAYELDALASKEPLVKRLLAAKVLIIDEISMLDGVTLSSVETICRTLRQKGEAFGGLQVIFVGDFFQLPPIPDKGQQARFAFDSDAWRRAKPLVCYISEQHRQEDQQFLSTLNAIRSGDVDDSVYEHLRTRSVESGDVTTTMTRLYTHNADVDAMNKNELGKIVDDEHSFFMESFGNERLLEGLKKNCLSPEELVLKEGAVVMFTKNNFEGGFVNGTLGIVSGFEPETGKPVVRTRDGRSITAYPMEWAVIDNGKELAKIIQLPLRLAWAITVHKSQGMSLDAAVMDLSRAFEYGQGYVALSRVRTLDGLHLLGFNARALAIHPTVLEMDSSFRAQSETADEAYDAMGEGELQDMHEKFLLAIGGTLEAKKRVYGKAGKKLGEEKIPTHEITRTLLVQGMSLEEMAKERGMTVGTVLSHLEKLLEHNSISIEHDLAHLRPEEEWLTPVLRAFHKVSKEEEKPSLTAVKRIVGDEYSFDDLKFARIFFIDK